jgi:hypothetical protein
MAKRWLLTDDRPSLSDRTLATVERRPNSAIKRGDFDGDAVRAALTDEPTGPGRARGRGHDRRARGRRAVDARPTKHLCKNLDPRSSYRAASSGGATWGSAIGAGCR